MNTLRDTILRWIDKRLSDMLATPRAWGSDEAVEAQVLLLLQFRMLTLQPDFDNGDPGLLVDQYMDYLKRAYPQKPNQPLHQIVPADRRGFNLAKELKKVVEVFKKNMRKENSFPHNATGTTLPAPQPSTPSWASMKEFPGFIAPPRMGGSVHAGVSA